MPTINTPYGPLEAHSVHYFPSGQPKSCIASERSFFKTPYGTVIPQFTANTLRKRQLPCMSFYQNGMIRSLPLEEQTLITTRLGDMPAEMISFHEDGSLKRIFPLNGTLSGYWTQEDEATLATSIRIETPVGSLETPSISLYFSPKGSLRSITFWPGTVRTIPTPAGTLAVRNGIRFDDNGILVSVEPAKPTSVETLLGTLTAYDPDAIGISGDVNSLCFASNGQVKRLVTVSHGFDIRDRNGHHTCIEPPLRRSYCDDETLEATPISISFSDRHVVFEGDGLETVTAPQESVTVRPFTTPIPLSKRISSHNTSCI